MVGAAFDRYAAHALDVRLVDHIVPSRLDLQSHTRHRAHHPRSVHRRRQHETRSRRGAPRPAPASRIEDPARKPEVVELLRKAPVDHTLVDVAQTERPLAQHQLQHVNETRRRQRLHPGRRTHVSCARLRAAGAPPAAARPPRTRAGRRRRGGRRVRLYGVHQDGHAR